jgi:hypothetical protein
MTFWRKPGTQGRQESRQVSDVFKYTGTYNDIKIAKYFGQWFLVEIATVKREVRW